MWYAKEPLTWARKCYFFITGYALNQPLLDHHKYLARNDEALLIIRLSFLKTFIGICLIAVVSYFWYTELNSIIQTGMSQPIYAVLISAIEITGVLVAALSGLHLAFYFADEMKTPQNKINHLTDGLKITLKTSFFMAIFFFLLLFVMRYCFAVKATNAKPISPFVCLIGIFCLLIIAFQFFMFIGCMQRYISHRSKKDALETKVFFVASPYAMTFSRLIRLGYIAEVVVSAERRYIKKNNKYRFTIQAHSDYFKRISEISEVRLIRSRQKSFSISPTRTGMKWYWISLEESQLDCMNGDIFFNQWASLESDYLNTMDSSNIKGMKWIKSPCIGHFVECEFRIDDFWTLNLVNQLSLLSEDNRKSLQDQFDKPDTLQNLFKPVLGEFPEEYGAQRQQKIIGSESIFI